MKQAVGSMASLPTLPTLICQTFAEQVNAAGGRTQVMHLPALGLIMGAS